MHPTLESARARFLAARHLAPTIARAVLRGLLFALAMGAVMVLPMFVLLLTQAPDDLPVSFALPMLVCFGLMIVDTYLPAILVGAGIAVAIAISGERSGKRLDDRRCDATLFAGAGTGIVLFAVSPLLLGGFWTIGGGLLDDLVEAGGPGAAAMGEVVHGILTAVGATLTFGDVLVAMLFGVPIVALLGAVFGWFGATWAGDADVAADKKARQPMLHSAALPPCCMHLYSELGTLTAVVVVTAVLVGLPLLLRGRIARNPSIVLAIVLGPTLLFVWYGQWDFWLYFRLAVAFAASLIAIEVVLGHAAKRIEASSAVDAALA